MKMARRGPGRDPDDTAPQLTEEVHMTAPNVAAKWSTWAPRLLSVLRIFTAFIFIQAGTMKLFAFPMGMPPNGATATRSEEHTSELQSRLHLVCRLLLEKKKKDELTVVLVHTSKGELVQRCCHA